jgi:hypothetical protein
VALIGLALHFALTLVYFLLAPASFDLLLVELALRLVNPVLVALLAVLVASCWKPEATSRARGLTVLSLLLTAGLFATALGLLLAGVLRAPADARAGMFAVFLGVVPWVTTAVIAIGVFVALLRRPSVAATPALVEAAAPVSTPAVDPQLQPGWSPDAAVGTVWRRAGDAAAGAPATSWEAPGQTAGWWGAAPAIEPPSYAPSDQPTAPSRPLPPPAERAGGAGNWPPPGQA